MIDTKKTNGIGCRLCGEKVHLIEPHLTEAHPDLGCSLEFYRENFPDAPTISAELLAKWDKNLKLAKKRKRYPMTPETIKAPTVNMRGVKCEVRMDVPAKHCLPLPDNYQLPKKGKLGEDVKEALESIISGRSAFIWGPPGTGKDALIHAYSAKLRRPSKVFQVNPTTDTQQWLYTMGFDANGVVWEEGELLKALKDGYTTPDGVRMGYLILVSDFDRAKTEQAEVMRMITDSISGRVQGPKGIMYDVFQPDDPKLPRTQVVFTGNSCGSGDTRNLCVSSNVMDSSLLNRINAKYRFHNMDWEDEEPIIRNKFSDVVERIGDKTLANVGKAVAALREAIDNDRILAEFSHRTACDWFLKMRDKITLKFSAKKLPNGFLKDCAVVFLDGMDEYNREIALSTINAFIKDGVLDEGGELGFIKEGEL